MNPKRSLCSYCRRNYIGQFLKFLKAIPYLSCLLLYMVIASYTYAQESSEPLARIKQTNDYVKITKIDKGKELISGEFSFVALDEITGKTITIDDGVFIDVEYE